MTSTAARCLPQHLVPKLPLLAPTIAPRIPRRLLVPVAIGAPVPRSQLNNPIALELIPGLGVSGKALDPSVLPVDSEVAVAIVALDGIVFHELVKAAGPEHVGLCAHSRKLVSSDTSKYREVDAVCKCLQ